ncbi:hypothetical protein RZR97_03140 [Hydrogenimonas thermophila]|uniref:hypothetical protein n=1 Tax=Hydrogenimonas thermophila TaxID=223786 RepID=UPI00293702D9|nr:hypothetical protein [Hydrogenimonas thermophila]WOE70574.1 hypothetical protein RZR91_03150 [Hydrogenimonas thermophila]WOE73092.1 hypothetical protein RZR97_03140 [Hydrogenimonas thermophila]
MKRLIKIIGYIVFTILITIALLPKVDLYYKLEQILKKEHIILSDETPSDKIFIFSVKDISLLYDDITVANISDTSLLPLFFYNKLTIENIKLNKTMKIFFPEKINEAVVTYSILDPLNIHLASKGNFGKAVGTLNLKTRKLHIVLTPSANMKKNHANTLSMMKSINGQYIYDKAL